VLSVHAAAGPTGTQFGADTIVGMDLPCLDCGPRINVSLLRTMKRPPANDRFLRACRGERVDATPVWFMRQAGRYMAEYRAVRAHHSLLEICRRPDLAAEVTLQPVERLGVDAAILFADILLLLEPLDVGLEFVGGDGPSLRRPIVNALDVDRLRDFDVETDLGYVAESVRAVVDRLNGRVPLIGFAGGPFTVASYLVEGGHSQTFAGTKRLMYGDPEAWHRLLSRLARLTADYLRMQIEAGVDAVQLFDSWAGALSPADYRRYVAPHARAILEPLGKTGAPVIHFGTQTAAILADMRHAGGTVIGVDWRIDLDEAWNRVGHDVAVQGNLDPAKLLAPWPVVSESAREILAGVAGRRGHVFNLGHGILPETPVETVASLVSFVHEESCRIAARARVLD
jgi:uroporphyrinogen decarboxylase